MDDLIAAHWDQWSPYNDYCPSMTAGPIHGESHQPAGCSPVAAGQLLQFLCSKYGNHFSYSYDGYTSSTDSLSLGYSRVLEGRATPLLLRFIGNLFEAEYTDSSTSVVGTLTKAKNFYLSHGINSTKCAYSTDKVKQNLSNGLPLLVTGASGPAASTEPEPYVGHAYIIDGYMRTRTATLEYYTRLVGYPPILEEKTDTVSYSSPHINAIKMNWGWWTQWRYGDNDGWYALTGDWYVSIPESYSFTNDVEILCDFSYSN